MILNVKDVIFFYLISLLYNIHTTKYDGGMKNIKKS